MHKEGGFTLVEVLLVLSIWSILILFVMPIDLDRLETKQEEKFLETLAFDVLYIQSLSTTVEDDHMRIQFYRDGYTVRVGTFENEMIYRQAPKGWSISYRVLPMISFDKYGRIKKPGNVLIHTNQTTYRIIFPFGKGRFYVVEQ